MNRRIRSPSGLIETFGAQTFRESAHEFNNMVVRFTERMGLIRPDRTTSVLMLAALFLMTAGTARAQVPVDLALVLALDSSASVDDREFALQRGGLADAFRDPEVVEAVAAGTIGRIAVAVMEWAGSDQQVLDIPWTLIQDTPSALGMADRIDRMGRGIPTGATSIAGALSFGNGLLRTAPVAPTRMAIDMSSDGRNNQGQKVEVVRRAVVAHGVTINGLVILNEHPTLNYYFEDRVIGGAGAFVEVANDYADYARAIRRKLIREIRSLTVSRGPRQGPITPAVDDAVQIAISPTVAP